MVKLEKDSLEVNYERLQLKSGFWDDNCVYLLVSFCFLFIVMLALIGNKPLHLCATVNALQIGVLMCITSLLPLVCLLLFSINAHNEWVSYIGLVIVIMMILLCFFFDSSTAPLFVSLSMRQDRNTVTRRSGSMFDAFIASWCFVC